MIGQTLGKYNILEQIGEGGMAIVYKAYDTRLEREVAIKIIRRGALPPDHLERILKRFEREAKSLAKLSHPNIVSVVEYGDHEGTPFLVMQYIPAGTLKSKLGKPIAWHEALIQLMPVAKALAYSHKHGIIHRDVKPSNILNTENGDLLLTDFGIAKLLEGDEGHTMITGTGVGIGTPEYMSPEQAMGEDVDARADIYSLGIVLYEMLIGRKPFTADTPMAVIVKHINEPLPRPQKLIPNLPDVAERILLKALAKQPKERYQDMNVFIKAMEQAIAAHQSGRVKISANIEETAISPRPFNARMGLAIGAAIVFIGLGFTAANSLWKTTPLDLSASSTPALSATAAPAKPTSTSTVEPTSTVTAAPTSAFTIGSTYKREIDGMVMVYVPAGEFTMGSDKGNGDEVPAHKLTLPAYWIDQTEVTNRQYSTCATLGGCTQQGHVQGWKDYYLNPDYADFPVNYIDWVQAKDYCKWVGGHLPTEAQWEKAARGMDARTYPWGNEAPTANLLNYNSFVGNPTKVGSYEAGKSPYGVYDMAGNMWEWTLSLASFYPYDPTDGRENLTDSQARILRGGAWFGSDAASFLRNRDAPNTAINVYGFRCAGEENP